MSDLIGLQYTYEFVAQFVWALLGICVLLLVSFIFLRYPLTWKRKSVLLLLRFGVLFLLLLYFSNPREFSEELMEEVVKGKSAVVFDVSGSMVKKSTAGRSRLKQARAYYESFSDELRKHMDVDLFTLNENVNRIFSEEKLTQFRDLNEPTHLDEGIFELLNELNDKNYDRLIVFTDGIDNGNVVLKKPLDEQQIKTVLVSAKQKLNELPYAEISRLEHPTAAFRKSVVPVDLFMEFGFLKQQEGLKVEVYRDEEIVHEVMVSANANLSRSLKHIRANILVQEEGWHAYRCVLRDGEDILDKVEFWIEGREPLAMNVLFYQKNVDLSTRHFKYLFDSETYYKPSFVFHPDSVDGEGEFRKPIEEYNLVVLSNMDYSILDDENREKVSSFVRNGGALLIMSGSSECKDQGLTSPFGKMTPILWQRSAKPIQELAFDPVNGSLFVTNDESNVWDAFQDFDARYKGFRDEESRKPLNKFYITPEGENTGIFQYADVDGTQQKLFPYYDRALFSAGVRPLAKVLARDRKGAVLMASQRVKEGFVAEMATGALWEWKESMSKDSLQYETFWRNLFAYLCSQQSRMDRWEITSLQKQGDTLFPLIFESQKKASSGEETPDFFYETEGVRKRFFPQQKKPHTWMASIPVSAGKKYRIVQKRGDIEVEAYFRPISLNKDYEQRKLAVDHEHLKYLRSRINAELVTVGDVDFDWSDWSLKTIKPLDYSVERYLWHHPLYFILVLIFLFADWWFRRKWGLI